VEFFSLAVEKDVAYVAGDGGVRAKLVFEKSRQFFVGWHVLRTGRGIQKDLNLVAESRDKVYYGFFVVHLQFIELLQCTSAIGWGGGSIHCL
jgi:hypothetical protein